MQELEKEFKTVGSRGKKLARHQLQVYSLTAWGWECIIRARLSYGAERRRRYT